MLFNDTSDCKRQLVAFEIFGFFFFYRAVLGLSLIIAFQLLYKKNTHTLTANTAEFLSSPQNPCYLEGGFNLPNTAGDSKTERKEPAHSAQPNCQCSFTSRTLGVGKSRKQEMGEGGAYPGSGGNNLRLTSECAGKQPTSIPKAVVRKKGIWSAIATRK